MTHSPSHRRSSRRLVAGLASIAVSATTLGTSVAAASVAAPDSTYLHVAYGGNFNVGNTYTSATGETMTGSFVRRTGAETLDPALGLTLGGGTQGMSFTPTDLSLGGAHLDQGIVLETTFTPGPEQAALGTLVAAGGNLWARYQNGKLRYGFDSNATGSWASYIKEAAVPSPETEHTLSLAYLPTTSVAGEPGASVVAFLDGAQLPQVDAPAARANLSANAVAPVGFGNDVHRAAVDRGFVGSLRASRFATASGPFDPGMFQLQQVSYVRTPLHLSFSGSLTNGSYAAGLGERVEGAVGATGVTVPEAGRADLAGAGARLTWDSTGLGERALAQPLLTELVVAPDVLDPGAVLVDLRGAVRLEAVDVSTVRIIGGGTSQTRSLPDPVTTNGVSNHHLSLWTSLDASGAGTATLHVGSTPVGDPVELTGAAPKGDAVTFLSDASGSAYGLAVSTGASAADRALDALPCTAVTLDPASRFAVTGGECAASVLSKASAVRPTARQVRWQEAEQTAFLHFGMNTFTDREWGDGAEDPALFQPTSLDTDQWARSLRDNGFRYAILTVKHHDGFVLYPSRYTDHDVAASGWQGGTGDVLRSFTQSARRYGLKVGVYLSPSDWNQYRKGVFANGSSRVERTIPTLVAGDDRAGRGLPTFTYEASDYGAYFLNQLYETLTEYGEVDEVWFDGADGGIPGASAERYDFAAWYDLIRRLQPQATIAVSGPDVRWVGNESGLARENEWSVVAVAPSANGGQYTVPGGSASDLGSDSVITSAVNQGARAVTWWPAEVDVSIRQGWFYHANQAPKSVEHLRTIYYQSVGRNSVLLLNVPPDRSGRLPSADVTRLGEWTARLRQDMPIDLLLGKPATAPELTDGDLRTAWVAPGPNAGAVTIDLGAATAVDRIVVGEAIAEGGQQVSGFTVEGRAGGGAWATLATSGTIGYRKTIALPSAVTIDELRLTITASRGAAHLAGLSAYRAAAAAPPRQSTFHVDCSAAVAGDGSSETTPLRSLGQLRQVNLPEGAQVLLRAGTTCAEPVELWGYGTAESPALLGTYGVGAAPVLTDPGADAALDRLRSQGWTVALQGVDPTPTATSLTLSTSSAAYGTLPAVRLTAAVSATDNSTAAGRVRFAVNGATVATVALGDDGTATIDLPITLAAGHHQVTATFVPPAASVLAASTSPAEALSVAQASSVTSLEVARGGAVKGARTVDLTIRVASGSSLPPAGVVTLTRDGQVVGSYDVHPSTGTTASVMESVNVRSGRAELVATFEPDEPGNVAGSSDREVVVLR